VPVRVLVVDDHAGFRSFARRLLVAAGLDVVGEAGNGAEAMTAVQDLRPDVVLLDVQLPDVDGFALSRRLAEQIHAPGVVLTSARPLADYGSREFPDGVLGFVPKAELSGPVLIGLLRVRP
jgi:DNA-binding NarL/FixJ family response regulator